MGVMGFTGERTSAGRRHRRGAQVARAAAGAMQERLEPRQLFAADSIGTVVNLAWKGSTIKVVQDQWVVKTTNAAGLNKLAAKQGFTALTSLGQNYYEFTSAASAAQMTKLAGAYPKALGGVQPNRVSTVATTLPTDAELVQQWGIHNTGQLESYDYNNNGVISPYNEQTYASGLPAGVTSDFPLGTNPDENQLGTPGVDINAQQAWDVTTGSSSVVVAVLDTGIDLTHPDLVNNIWTNPLAANSDGYVGDTHGYNFVSNTADVTDDNGHGTNVSGIIGAQGNNGIGVTGVNWNVKILPVKVADASGSLSTASIIAGINYVINLKDQGINIVAMNESFGGGTFPADALESDATQQAGRAGVLTVAAAGNDGADVDKTVFSPAKFSGYLDSVITVAAVDNQGKLAPFSNYGSQLVSIAAPGVNIYSTLPTYATYQELLDQATTQAEIAPYYLPPPLAVSYGFESGTSQATPFVTGVIALEAAANPTASPAQLKAALLQSATYDAYLAPANGLPSKVATSGIVNAYKAVVAIQNVAVGTDTTRQGSWVGYYGSQGAYVAGDSAAFPTGFVNVTPSGGAPVIVQDTTKNPAALQRATDPSSRVSAYIGSATTETISLSFTDGAKHRTRLYVVDPDHKKRSELISIVDVNTGQVVDSRLATNFTKGQYFTWDLQGNVNIVITSQSGGAAYSGLFFDAPDTKVTTFYNLDANTFGTNWRDTYGSQGDYIYGDTNASTLPSYVSLFNTVGGAVDVLRSTTRDRRALEKNGDTTRSIQAYTADPSQIDVNVGFNDTIAHKVTLYLADYDNRKRSERVQVIDAATGSVLVTQDVTSFKNGVFVSFNVTGAVTFRVTNTGGPSAVVSGVFFDAPFGESGHFDGTDLTTGGNWKTSSYGTTAGFVVGDSFPGLNVAADARLSLAGLTGQAIIGRFARDNAALLTAASGNNKARIGAYAFTTSSMTLTYTPGDAQQHELSLYFADLENAKRVETVTMLDATTGAVLSKVVLSDFRQGKYLNYDLNTSVKIVIQAVSGPNAVLGGVFID